MNGSGNRNSRAGEKAEYVSVTVCGQCFGLAIAQVQDVFRPRNVTAVALAPPEIAGLLNLRGRVATAIDMRRRLALPPRAPDASCMAVGVERSGELYGLIVDHVGDVLRLASEGIEANPVNLDTRWAAVSKGVYRLDEALLVILDIARVLSIGQQADAA